jgi:membrane-associated protein
MLSAWLFHLFSTDDTFRNLLIDNWLAGVGLVAAVDFVETGLVLFPFLPGDSLLFATGAFLGAGGINPAPALAMLALAAVLGDSINYKVGQGLGRRLLQRTRWVKPHHVQRTESFFVRFGGFAIVAGRFVPIVRTLAPFLAGVSRMPYSRFLAYNLIGGFGWTSLFLCAGVWLGRIEWVRQHLAVLTFLIVVLSLFPVIRHFTKHASAATE